MVKKIINTVSLVIAIILIIYIVDKIDYTKEVVTFIDNIINNIHVWL